MRHKVCFSHNPGEIVLLKLHPNYIWESDAIFRQISCATGYWELYYTATTTVSMKFEYLNVLTKCGAEKFLHFLRAIPNP